MEYIGIHVHKKETQICVLTEEGELIERRMRTLTEWFGEVLGGRPRARILLEASTESEWVARCLEGLGHEVIVADPNFGPMDATRTRKVKTDRRDARALTEANVLGAYRPAHRTSSTSGSAARRAISSGAPAVRRKATPVVPSCPAASITIAAGRRCPCASKRTTSAASGATSSTAARSTSSPCLIASLVLASGELTCGCVARADPATRRSRRRASVQKRSEMRSRASPATAHGEGYFDGDASGWPFGTA
jgi:hypothetical protein